MTKPWLTGLLVVILVCVAAPAAAQDPTPEAAPPAGPDEAPPPLAEDAPAPAELPPAAATPVAAEPAPELAADVAALKAEVAALKEKAEEAELAALTAELPPDAPLEADLIRVYGFMDFGIDKAFFRSPEHDALLLVRPSKATTFVFGNLNLYVDANPTEDVRSLVELRFTLAPHGEELSLGPPINTTSYERIDTVAFDFSSPTSQAQLRLGGIYIERAWTQYKFSELFKLQWGLYLTPFGIWNLDHGSPTLIALMLPTFIASQMIPGRLLGLNLYGSTFFGSTELGYAVHVSNGRTPLDLDLTEDKSLGLRAYLSHEGDFGRVVFGASGYIGGFDDIQKVITGNPDDFLELEHVVDYAEQILGLDAALDIGNFRARSEAVFRWVTYNDGRSERIFSLDGSELFLPNRLEWDAYVLFAYRTPWKLEPYTQVELAHKSFVLPRFAGTYRAAGVGPTPLYVTFGLNIELTTHTLLKAQYAWTRSYTSDDLENYNLTVPYLYLRLVSSF